MDRDKEDEQSVPLAHGRPEEDDLDSEYGSQSSSTPFNGSHHVPARRRRTCRTYLCSIIGYTLCAALFTFIGAQITRHNLDLDARCARYTNNYSPLIKEVDIKYSMKQFNGTFMVEDVYRRPGSPEVDAAWEALGLDSRPGVISEEDGLASGLGPGHLQVSKKYGGGFFVNVEGMHHLHCLNLVRKSLYFNYDYYKKMGHHAFGNSDDILHLHVTHCLDTIRQVLMCNADTGVLGQVWSLVQSGEGSHEGGSGHGHGQDQLPSHAIGSGSETHEDGSDVNSTHERRRIRRVRRHGDDDDDNDDSTPDAATTAKQGNSKGAPPRPQAFPDFNTRHKCKNFDAIREYAVRLQAPPNEHLPPDFIAHPNMDYVVMGTP
ncbi:oxidase UstYa family protein [Microdochium nivale]|nr:oxidase UstYa family protein [Microdochium nivale]